SGQQLRDVRLWPCRGAVIEQSCRLVSHQVCRTDVGIGPRGRKPDPRVLAKRPIEYDALARVSARPVDEPVAIADALGGDENPFGVDAVEQITKALPFLSDKVF